ncbi:hypothetical protein AWB78_08303 [Caballeronia calidae]|uniref:Uncharacterized protein n=2 Tax=Caballeronia calidae TaxID=1777139 RepID=A0A158EJ27_9BURK|nr:hypothetical protein AWB78_08303 [Caballeronia calidae]
MSQAILTFLPLDDRVKFNKVKNKPVYRATLPAVVDGIDKLNGRCASLQSIKKAFRFDALKKGLEYLESFDSDEARAAHLTTIGRQLNVLLEKDQQAAAKGLLEKIDRCNEAKHRDSVLFALQETLPHLAAKNRAAVARDFIAAICQHGSPEQKFYSLSSLVTNLQRFRTEDNAALPELYGALETAILMLPADPRRAKLWENFSKHKEIETLRAAPELFFSSESGRDPLEDLPN